MSPAVTAARCSSIRAPAARTRLCARCLLRLRHVLRDLDALYRFTDGGELLHATSSSRAGINLTDRSEFYVPFVMNQQNPNQLFVGSYRLYRTDDARRRRRDWNADQRRPDDRAAPAPLRTARATCAISAIGVGGGTAVYAGTLDGLVWVSPDAQTADTPTWVQVNAQDEQAAEPAGSRLRGRPQQLPDRVRRLQRLRRGDARRHPGHVFATTDGGQTGRTSAATCRTSRSTRSSLDPSYPNTLYAGTDVGPFVTYNGGAHWAALGTGMPTVAVWQLDLDPLHRIIAAGTHGRGAFRLGDTAPAAPALVVVEGRRGRPGRAGEQPRLHDHAAEHRQRPAHRRDDHRPDPGATRASSPPSNGGTLNERHGDVVGPERARRAAASSVHADGEHRRRAQEEGHVDHERRRQGNVRPGPVHDRLAGRDADRAARSP